MPELVLPHRTVIYPNPDIAVGFDKPNDRTIKPAELFKRGPYIELVSLIGQQRIDH